MRLSTGRRGKNRVKANERLGRLLTIKIVGRDKWKNIIWKCKCDCGNIVKRPATLLAKGHTKSCGCLRKERFHKLIYKHGKRQLRIYKIWALMHQRCKNPKASGYKNYGGRGITICKEWESFIVFYKDMIVGYSDKLSIDRINNDGNYEKSNCRWATMKVQQNNKNRI